MTFKALVRSYAVWLVVVSALGAVAAFVISYVVLPTVISSQAISTPKPTQISLSRDPLPDRNQTPVPDNGSQKAPRQPTLADDAPSHKTSSPLKPLLRDSVYDGFEIKSDVVTMQRSFRDQLFRDKALSRKLSGGAVLVPNILSGKLLGFTLAGIKANTVLFDAGLRNGDTIDAINGQAINTMIVAARQLGLLQRSTQGTLRLRRDHETRTISFLVR